MNCAHTLDSYFVLIWVIYLITPFQIIIYFCFMCIFLIWLLHLRIGFGIEVNVTVPIRAYYCININT